MINRKKVRMLKNKTKINELIRIFVKIYLLQIKKNGF